MYTSPVRSTPLEGASANSNWTFHSAVFSPCSLDVRKKLFDAPMEDENEQKQWSPSSEYFSQSFNECSGFSGGSQTHLFSDSSPTAEEQVCLNNSTGTGNVCVPSDSVVYPVDKTISCVIPIANSLI